LEYIECTYLQNLISFPACFFDVFSEHSPSRDIPRQARIIHPQSGHHSANENQPPEQLSLLRESQVVVLRKREHAFWRQWPFRVHGSTVSAGRQALHFPGRKIDERFTCMGGYFFWAAQLAFELGSARAGSRVTPAGANVRKVMFRGSIPFTERDVSRTREHRFCRATWSSGPASLPSLAHQSGWLGVLWQPRRPIFFPNGCFT